MRGRDVDDLGAGGELAGEGGAEELVDADEECGEGFSGAGGGGDEGGFAGEDAGPAVVLRLGGGAEFCEEPLGCDGVGPGEGFGNFERHGLIVARFLFVVCSLYCYVRIAGFVLPDRPAARGAATSWRVYPVSVKRWVVALPLVGREHPLHVAVAYVGGGGGGVVFVEVLLDDFFEGALGSEDEVDGVAAGTEAAGVGGDVVGGGFDLLAGVGGGDGETALAHDGEVDDVVADVGELVQSVAVLARMSLMASILWAWPW